MNISKKLHILVSVLVLSFVFNASADQSGTILTVRENATTIQVFDFEALSTMKSTKFETTTIWTEGVQSFEGVPLKTLLEDLKITDGMVLATAVNDYAVEIPISEISSSAPVIAYKQNGERMSLRDKGPLWLVYPYDAHPEFQTEVTYSRSIWQLNRIEVK
ncbi:molybdopterin-dependent oxidoreductase [Lentilitoribacter sp. Alg239-R112]|uniref:molybdopterin-dependent oxidoreductase n=1 Tax=Lentilitoribacter sp. Alg239-R112 TaxID=2305987 RepID=UPI0013A6BB83|nr:molybdopterin-dependent oxidoreductase [Lentilitoribacter sp. Alg239-R112]